jgi:hypothetical protein
MGFGLPNFQRRREKLEPITFVPVSKAFEPQIRVQALRDINGWVDKRERKKWHIGRHQVGMLNEKTAREFEVKGYVRILEGDVKPVSEDEAAEMLSTVTTITMGVS